jgi:hypothetical protein
MDTSFAYITHCIDVAAHRRHRKSFDDMGDEGKCKFFNKIMEFIKEATWDNLESFLLYVMNKGRMFYLIQPMFKVSLFSFILKRLICVKNLKLKDLTVPTNHPAKINIDISCNYPAKLTRLKK